mmetsp:Transcript_42818/g.100386  ORF Transcript_42818/g.100386 Transcript_42818/m.100386 type:complete len:192 (-) Transcript_42818:1526-2101(-)
MKCPHTIACGSLFRTVLLLQVLTPASSWRFEFYDDPSCTGPLSTDVDPNPMTSRGRLNLTLGAVTPLNLICNPRTGLAHDAFLALENTFGVGSRFVAYAERGCQPWAGLPIINPSLANVGHGKMWYVKGYIETTTCTTTDIFYEFTVQYFDNSNCGPGDVSNVMTPNLIKGNSYWGRNSGHHGMYGWSSQG